MKKEAEPLLTLSGSSVFESTQDSHVTVKQAVSAC